MVCCSSATPGASAGYLLEPASLNTCHWGCLPRAGCAWDCPLECPAWLLQLREHGTSTFSEHSSWVPRENVLEGESWEECLESISRNPGVCCMAFSYNLRSSTFPPLRFKGKGIKKFEEYFFETPTGGNDICMLRNILAFTERKRQIQAVRGTDRSIVTNHMIFLKVWYQCDKRGVIFSTCNLLKQKILYFV